MRRSMFRTLARGAALVAVLLLGTSNAHAALLNLTLGLPDITVFDVVITVEGDEMEAQGGLDNMSVETDGNPGANIFIVNHMFTLSANALTGTGAFSIMPVSNGTNGAARRRLSPSASRPTWARDACRCST